MSFNNIITLYKTNIKHYHRDFVSVFLINFCFKMNVLDCPNDECDIYK